MDRKAPEGLEVESSSESDPSQHSSRDLIPREYLRTLAVWSLVPGYTIAGALVGYAADRWLGTFPYLTALGLLVALILAVRDIYRLRGAM
jgi:F0F1-type ATP synthase assembly protein I